MFNYKSYADLSRDIAANLQKLPPVDIVVGIPRSGLIPAMMISSLRNVTFHDLDQFQYVFSARSGMRKTINGTESKIRVLVVDDSVNAGTELARTRKKLSHLQSELDISYCAIYGTEPGAHSDVADIILSYVRPPRFFQWNYRNHIVARHTIFDLDGVLCVDPTDEQNDDGEAYLDFLATASPLTIPTERISAIATSRLEKYRPQTEDWLERHGVNYSELFMLDLPSAEERRRQKAHAPFKAEIYKSRDEYLFIESNWKQAQIIARDTDKAVICTENDFLIFGRDHIDRLETNRALPSLETDALEFDLQRKIDLLINRVIQTDRYAAYWVRQSGIRFEVSRAAEASPFLKSRIITASLQSGRRNKAKSARPKDRRRRILMICVTFKVERGAGAAASSVRLRDLLIAAGVDVQTISLDNFPEKSEPRSDQPIEGTKIGFWNSYSDGDHWKSVRRTVLEFDPDCIILGAVDRGIVSMFDIARLDYPIVWVSRDNWAHTGGCLFKLQPEDISKVPAVHRDYLSALTCEGYKHGCHHCPALKDIRESAKARINFEFKRLVLNYRSDIVFAPISQWMADMLRDAPLTQNHEIAPVGNPINLNVVRRLKERPRNIREELGLSEDHKLVLLAAHSLTNPRKGLTKSLLESLAADSRLSDVVFVRMGKEKPGQLSSAPSLRIHSLGFVESEEEKVEIINEVDATLVPALQESLSVVASDSICCGTPVVAYATSGLNTFLRHRETGYLAKKFDVADLIDGLCWVLFGGQRERFSAACLKQAQQNFDSVKNTESMLATVNLAIEKHEDLPSLPIEIKTLASAMELLHEDLHFRSDHVRHLNRRIKDVSATKDMNPNKLFDELERTRKKLAESQNKIRELKATIDQRSSEKA